MGPNRKWNDSPPFLEFRMEPLHSKSIMELLHSWGSSTKRICVVMLRRLYPLQVVWYPYRHSGPYEVFVAAMRLYCTSGIQDENTSSPKRLQLLLRRGAEQLFSLEAERAQEDEPRRTPGSFSIRLLLLVSGLLILSAIKKIRQANIVGSFMFHLW